MTTRTPCKTSYALRTGRGQAFYLLVAVYMLAARLPAQTSEHPGAPDALHQLNSSVEALTRRVSPSVVQVLVTGYGPLEDGGRGQTGVVLGRQRSIGSGVIVDPEGYIVTNAHVVSGAQRIQVVLSTPPDEAFPLRSLLSARGRTVEARVVGVSREIDLSLLKIEAHGLPALPIGKYGKLRQGEIVFAFGSPEGLQNSVTMGVVSAVARQPDPDSPMIFIQTDAPINPGNSGGPLVDVDGELVGINTFILSESGGNEGLGFAIPSGVVAFAYPQLRKFGHIHRGEIGLSVQTVTPNLAAALGLTKDSGVIVSDLVPGGPADSAGLKIQDIILSVDDRPVESLPMFGYSFYLHDPGDAVELEILRGSGKLLMKVPVIERPHDVDRLLDFADSEKNLIRKLGILGIEISSKVAALLPGLRMSSGVIVAAKAAGSGVSENPLTTGDVIHSLNREAITSLEGLRSAVEHLKPESPVALQIEREGKLMYVAFQME